MEDDTAVIIIDSLIAGLLAAGVTLDEIRNASNMILDKREKGEAYTMADFEPHLKEARARNARIQGM